MEEQTRKIREKEFRKGTPLAPIIWKWEELKDLFKQENFSCSDWLNKTVSQVGLVSATIEKNDKMKTEDELIALAALCLTWIEQIRTERKKR